MEKHLDMKRIIRAAAALALCILPSVMTSASAGRTGNGDNAGTQDPETYSISSPDGRQCAEVSISVLQDSGHTGEGNTRISYSTFLDGRAVITESAMDIEIDNHVWEHAMGKFFKAHERWFDDLKLKSVTETSRDTVWHNRFGERSTVRDAYNGMIFHFAKDDASKYSLDIEVRAYDEGIAFRYMLPMHPDAIYHRIKADNTEFSFPDGSMAWYTSWAQGPYELRPFEGWEDECERPMTVKISDSLYASVGEAGQTDFPRTKLRLSGTRPNTVVAALNDNGTDVVTPYNMPWRVVMAADRLGDLVENNDIYLNLNEPSAIGDDSWIRPGKIMRETRLTTENALAVIDFCAAHNMQYLLFDAKWYGPEFDYGSDATKVTAPIDMPEVIAYGKEKGVGIWLYVNQHALHQQAEELFPLFEEWGVAGVKFGFVQFCNQHWADWVHRMVRLAARHHLMVNIHDEYRPTGYSRTYPNLLTQEGIRGNEEFPSAGHDTVLPFTRMLCGAGDYTVCYFDPRIKNTHAHQLAFPIVFFSPLQTLYWYDTPARIKEVPELELFDNIPVVWDDTRVIDDSIGEHVAIARRSGEEWYAGALAGDEACGLEVNTGEFLEEGREYLVRTYTDDMDADTPTKVKVSGYLVKGGDILKFRLQARGGAVMHFIPADGISTKGYKKPGKKTIL